MFSVILPAFNCERTIERVLNSIISQTRSDLIEEIIIINDGSTDYTEDEVKKFQHQNKHVNIIYEKQENKGVSFTRNKGIRMAKAEWIALIDSDDCWLPAKLEKQVHFIENNKNIVFMGTDDDLILGRKIDGALYKIDAKALCIRNTPVTPSVIFKKDVGIELGLFDEKMRYGEDINFYQKFLLKDSYYILAEKLVEIGIGKEYFGESGLTSNLYMMHLGRKRNTKELYEMGMISKPYEQIMQFMNNLKYVRRVLIRKLNRIGVGKF